MHLTESNQTTKLKASWEWRDWGREIETSKDGYNRATSFLRRNDGDGLSSLRRTNHVSTGVYICCRYIVRKKKKKKTMFNLVNKNILGYSRVMLEEA